MEPNSKIPIDNDLLLPPEQSAAVAAITLASSVVADASTAIAKMNCYCIALRSADLNATSTIPLRADEISAVTQLWNSMPIATQVTAISTSTSLSRPNKSAPPTNPQSPSIPSDKSMTDGIHSGEEIVLSFSRLLLAAVTSHALNVAIETHQSYTTASALLKVALNRWVEIEQRPPPAPKRPVSARRRIPGEDYVSPYSRNELLCKTLTPPKNLPSSNTTSQVKFNIPADSGFPLACGSSLQAHLKNEQLAIAKEVRAISSVLHDVEKSHTLHKSAGSSDPFHVANASHNVHPFFYHLSTLLDHLGILHALHSDLRESILPSNSTCMTANGLSSSPRFHRKGTASSLSSNNATSSISEATALSFDSRLTPAPSPSGSPSSLTSNPHVFRPVSPSIFALVGILVAHFYPSIFLLERSSHSELPRSMSVLKTLDPQGNLCHRIKKSDISPLIDQLLASFDLGTSLSSSSLSSKILHSSKNAMEWKQHRISWLKSQVAVPLSFLTELLTGIKSARMSAQLSRLHGVRSPVSQNREDKVLTTRNIDNSLDESDQSLAEALRTQLHSLEKCLAILEQVSNEHTLIGGQPNLEADQFVDSNSRTSFVVSQDVINTILKTSSSKIAARLEATKRDFKTISTRIQRKMHQEEELMTANALLRLGKSEISSKVLTASLPHDLTGVAIPNETFCDEITDIGADFLILNSDNDGDDKEMAIAILERVVKEELQLSIVGSMEKMHNHSVGMLNSSACPVLPLASPNETIPNPEHLNFGFPTSVLSVATQRQSEKEKLTVVNSDLHHSIPQPPQHESFLSPSAWAKSSAQTMSIWKQQHEASLNEPEMASAASIRDQPFSTLFNNGVSNCSTLETAVRSWTQEETVLNALRNDECQQDRMVNTLPITRPPKLLALSGASTTEDIIKDYFDDLHREETDNCVARYPHDTSHQIKRQRDLLSRSRSFNSTTESDFVHDEEFGCPKKISGRNLRRAIRKACTAPSPVTDYNLSEEKPKYQSVAHSIYNPVTDPVLLDHHRVLIDGYLRVQEMEATKRWRRTYEAKKISHENGKFEQRLINSMIRQLKPESPVSDKEAIDSPVNNPSAPESTNGSSSDDNSEDEGERFEYKFAVNAFFSALEKACDESYSFEDLRCRFGKQLDSVDRRGIPLDSVVRTCNPRTFANSTSTRPLSASNRSERSNRHRPQSAPTARSHMDHPPARWLENREQNISRIIEYRSRLLLSAPHRSSASQVHHENSSCDTDSVGTTQSMNDVIQAVVRDTIPQPQSNGVGNHCVHQVKKTTTSFIKRVLKRGKKSAWNRELAKHRNQIGNHGTSSRGKTFSTNLSVKYLLLKRQTELSLPAQSTCEESSILKKCEETLRSNHLITRKDSSEKSKSGVKKRSQLDNLRSLCKYRGIPYQPCVDDIYNPSTEDHRQESEGNFNVDDGGETSDDSRSLSSETHSPARAGIPPCNVCETSVHTHSQPLESKPLGPRYTLMTTFSSSEVVGVRSPQTRPIANVKLPPNKQAPTVQFGTPTNHQSPQQQTKPSHFSDDSDTDGKKANVELGNQSDLAQLGAMLQAQNLAKVQLSAPSVVAEMLAPFTAKILLTRKSIENRRPASVTIATESWNSRLAAKQDEGGSATSYCKKEFKETLRFPAPPTLRGESASEVERLSKKTCPADAAEQWKMPYNEQLHERALHRAFVENLDHSNDNTLSSDNSYERHVKARESKYSYNSEHFGKSFRTLEDWAEIHNSTTHPSLALSTLPPQKPVRFGTQSHSAGASRRPVSETMIGKQLIVPAPPPKNKKYKRLPAKPPAHRPTHTAAPPPLVAQIDPLMEKHLSFLSTINESAPVHNLTLHNLTLPSPNAESFDTQSSDD